MQVEREPPAQNCLELCEDLPLLTSGKQAEVKSTMVRWGLLYKKCQARQACLVQYSTP